MSEPVGTEDLEDVVASVRRLVSPEARPRAVLSVPGPDLLVLTPALRVVPEREAPPVLVLTAPAAEPEPQLPDPAPDGAPAPVPDGAPAPAPDGAPTPVRDEPESRFQVVDDEWLDAFRDERDAAAAHDGQAAAPMPGAEPLVAVPLDANLDASLAGAAAEIDQPPEPTSVVAFPQFAEARASLAATPDTARDGDRNGDLGRLTDTDGNPVTVIDEAALHEIVRALIREELQGVLGERITRNMRKLVRAEINRALTARALD